MENGQHHHTVPRAGTRIVNGFVVGTPSAIGAIRVRKSSTLSGSPLVVHDFVKKAVHDYDEASDAEQLEFDSEDARLVLEVARSHRIVCRLEQELAQAKSDESVSLCNLYKYRAEEAGRRLECAEYDIGCVRNTMVNNGIAIHASDISGSRRPKRRCSGLSSSG